MSEFLKTDKQKEAINLLSSGAKHICLYGGSRAGKTSIILYAIIVRACKEKCRQAILRLNFNAAKRSIWLDSLPSILHKAFPNLKVKWNKTDYFIELPNGSQIFIGGLDDKERTEKILGTEYSTIFFNEVSQIDYNSIQVALTRLAEKNSLRKLAIYDQNPGTKASWTYWLFEKKLNPIDDEPLPDPENYKSMLLVPNDNIQNLDPEYLKILESMPEKEKNRFLFGLYNDESQGQVYYSFRRETHVKEFNKFGGTIFIGEDFNCDPGTSVIGYFIDNKFWIWDEVYLPNSDTYKMSDEMKKRGYGGGRIIPDSTARNRKTSGQSDLDILKQAGFHIESTYNPFVVDRVNNVNRLLQQNRIVIHPRCKKLINDLERVCWKDNKLDQSGDNKHLTHISDALGYMLWKLDPISAAGDIKIQSQLR